MFRSLTLVKDALGFMSCIIIEVFYMAVNIAYISETIVLLKLD